MSERVVETQVIEVKLRGAPDLKALEVTATKARDSLEAARAKLAALAEQLPAMLAAAGLQPKKR